MQFIACNRDRYIVRDVDEALVKERCLTSAAGRAAAARRLTLLCCLLAALSLVLGWL